MSQESYMYWARYAGDTRVDVTLKTLHKNCSVYLIPTAEINGNKRRAIESYHRIIFELELAGWTIDELEWPPSWSLVEASDTQDVSEMFLEWFDAEICPPVIDLGSEPIMPEKRRSSWMEKYRKGQR